MNRSLVAILFAFGITTLALGIVEEGGIANLFVHERPALQLIAAICGGLLAGKAAGKVIKRPGYSQPIGLLVFLVLWFVLENVWRQWHG